MTEKEIVKSLKQLGRLHKSVKQDPLKERESYNMLLNSFREMFPGTPKIHMSFYLALRPVAVSLMTLLIVTFSGFGLLKASENTVPGHFLYTFKRVAEKTQLVFAFNQSKKTVLRADILTNRLQEVKILAKNVEKGDTKASDKLNVLTKQVNDEMQSLKREVASKVTPFPNDQLLYIEDDLPVQDGRLVFTANQTEDLERLLAQTHELLAEKNLSAALVRIEEAIQVSQNKEPVTKEDIGDCPRSGTVPDSNENAEEIGDCPRSGTAPDTETEGETEKETKIEIKDPVTNVVPLNTQFLNTQVPPACRQAGSTQLTIPPASTGELFQGINMERIEAPNKEVGTGLVREK